MEIRDYLRAIRRILPLLIILPIVAAAVTGFILEKQPSKYQASATVIVPAISGNGTSQSAASQYVDTFKDVLVSQPVVADVAQKFKSSKFTQAELVAGLSADTVTASSNVIHITLVGEHGQNLTGAVREAAVDSMDAIAQPSLVQALSEKANSDTLWLNAQNDINKWVASTGNPSPPAKYNTDESQLTTDEGLLQQAILNGDTARQAGLHTVIANQTKLVETDGQQLQQYQSLDSALSSAEASQHHAEQVLVTAQALVATDHAPSTVTVVNNGRLSKLSDVIKFAAIAFALALLMMLGLILILELMRSNRRPVAVVAPAPEQGAFAWQAAPPASSQADVSQPATGGDEPRDPWRANPEPVSTTATAVADGNGNGNGHANGNGNGQANGNGHADAPPIMSNDPEPAQRGFLRRR
jgi:capsular polysaccharide biosynthesis protein